MHILYKEFQLHVIAYRGYLMLYRVFVFILSLIFSGYNLLLLLIVILIYG